MSQYLVLQTSKLPLLGGGLCPRCPCLDAGPHPPHLPSPRSWIPPLRNLLFASLAQAQGLPCSGKKPQTLPLHPGLEHLTSTFTRPTNCGFSPSRGDRALCLTRLLFLPCDPPAQPVSLTWEPTSVTSRGLNSSPHPMPIPTPTTVSPSVRAFLPQSSGSVLSLLGLLTPSSCSEDGAAAMTFLLERLSYPGTMSCSQEAQS